MLEIESKHSVSIEELMRTLYVDQELSIQGIADTLGITYVVARKWLKKAGIYSGRLW